MMKKLLAAALIFTLAGVVVGLTISSRLGIQQNGYSEVGAKPAAGSGAVSDESVRTLEALSNAMVEVASVVRPSVVNISTTRVIHGQRDGGPGFNPFYNDPFFRRFFGEEFGRQFGEPRERKESNLGSGIIIDKKGYILTNHHVIKDADEIVVTLSDEREYKGKVVGSDPKTDVAVVRIEADGDLPAARLGDSDKLRVGEMVFAVGSPYGLSQTVTSGIVSATGRSNVRISDYEDFIQTDAPINPGNSGGPLINIHGEVVGINTAIFSTSGGYQGIGFAIPLKMAKVIMDSLITEGKVVRGWLGVTIQPVTKEIAGQFGHGEEKGILVSDVTEGSPAEKAGLERGDIIIELDGKALESTPDLRNAIAATKPGREVKLTILREGKRMTKSVEIGELPSDGGAAVAAEEGETFENALKGVHVQELTPEIREQMRVSARIKGVVVSYSEEEVGLRQGDVILEVNRRAVRSVKEYQKTVSGIKGGEDVLLLVYRDGGVFYMAVPGE